MQLSHGCMSHWSWQVKCVHEDLRAVNVFVRERDGSCDVRFVDIDWAGPASQQQYPSSMNHR